MPPVFPLAGGHRETLVSLDGETRAIAFTFADYAAGLRVRRYLSRISARPITVSNHTVRPIHDRLGGDAGGIPGAVTQANPVPEITTS